MNGGCVKIEGDADTLTVKVNGSRLLIAPGLRIYNHSPQGFNWGYGGSGPAQLSIAILLRVLKDEILVRQLYQDFKRDFVAKWRFKEHIEETIDVWGWVKSKTEGTKDGKRRKHNTGGSV